MAWTNAVDVVFDDGASTLIAGLAQTLVDLLSAVGVGVEPTHNLTLEGIELADPYHALARDKLFHVGPFGNGAHVQSQGACSLGMGELVATQVVADLTEGFIVEHGGAPSQGVGPDSPEHSLSGVAGVLPLVAVAPFDHR